MLGHDALRPLLAQLDPNATRVSMLRNATWTLSNFCRGKPQPAFEQVRPALPTLAGLIFSSDEEVLTDSCWALSYLSDGTNEKIQAVIEAGVSRRLVELLMHTSPQASLSLPASFRMSYAPWATPPNPKSFILPRPLHLRYIPDP